MKRTRPDIALIVAALALAPLVAGCSKTQVPSSFDLVAKSDIAGVGEMQIVRDTGTGCEWVVTPHGLQPRNERSTDGTSIKQRCLATGGEDTPASMTAGGIPAMPTQTSAAAPSFAAPAIPSAAQADIQAEVQKSLTTPAPSRSIPPPKGARRAVAPVAANDGSDGVEGQLK